MRFTHLYTAGLDGAPPERLDFGLARTISYGPDGGLVIGRNTDHPAHWKRYRGGRTTQFWVKEIADEAFSPLIQLNGNLTSPIWIGGKDASLRRIYFISDYEGIGNLYSCLPSGEDLRRHTDHEDFYPVTHPATGSASFTMPVRIYISSI